jgi:hypothetical protein
MSLRTLFIWIIIAGMLGGAAVLVRQRAVRSNLQQEIVWVGLDFDPASTVSLRIERAGEDATLTRDTETIDRWVGSWDEGRGTETWAISATRVRGALRALATARVRLGDDDLIADESGVITLVGRSGAKTTVQLGSGRSGGRTPVRVERRDEFGAVERLITGWLESSVPDALTLESVRSWREQRLLNLAASSVTRVGLGAGANAVTLERRSGGWWITDPIELHADQAAVDALVPSLLAIEAQRFVEGEIDDATTGLGSPLATIVIGDGDSMSTLQVGGRADVGGDTMYARFTGSDRSALITVSTDALAKLTAVADAYVSKLAGPFATTAVRTVSVRGRDGQERLRTDRDGSQWRIGDRNADTLTNESIDRLVSILLRQAAIGVLLIGADIELPNPIAGVELLDRSGQALGSYDIALEQGADGLRLLVIHDLADGRRVVWAYAGDEAAATGTWLTVAASRRVPVSN